MTVHSPFHVVEDFISASKCEKIIEELGIKVPSYEGTHPIRHDRIIKDGPLSELIQTAIYENLADIQTRFKGIVKGMESPLFQQYFEDPQKPCEIHACENSKYARKKWVQVKDVDLVGYVWLKDYGAGVPLDPRSEVYGGKLEFPAYNFSLVPQRGTLVLFPAGPHFITAISPVLVGNLAHIKITLKLSQADGGVWLYQPSEFPGTYQDWFE